MKRFVSSMLLLAFAGGATAAPVVHYTGQLNNGGVAFDGLVNLTFAIYENEADEVPIWTEVHSDIPVEAGRFKVRLFENQDMTATDLGLDVLFMGIAINEGAELMPRESLSAAARARVASTALDVVGDINPSSLSINNRLLINNEGQWVGDAGPAGEAGPVGPEGPAGNDGVSVQVAMINEAGELVLTLSDGTTLNAGVARGADGAGGGEQGAAGEAGPAGEPGVGIESANINEGGDLVLTLTDATIVNAGNARGVEGAVGPAGEAGEAGPAGSAGISIDTAVINEGGGLDSYLD